MRKSNGRQRARPARTSSFAPLARALFRDREQGGRGVGCHAVVLAGGNGRRLADVTRRIEGRPVPKQYAAFGRGPSLLQQTMQRIANLGVASRTHVVIDASHVARARRQIESSDHVNVLVQPCDRGTAAGVLLPLAAVLAENPDATVVLTPSDHGIGNEDVFRAGIVDALRAIAAGRAPVVLFGVEADRPRTDYGWVVPGPRIAPGLRRVDGFVEKPPLDVATRLRAQGALWNSMVVVAGARALWELYEACLPGLPLLFDTAADLPAPLCEQYLHNRYEGMEAFDFSRDVLGAARGLAVYTWERTLDWTDLGTPERLHEWLARHGADVPASLGELAAGR